MQIKHQGTIVVVCILFSVLLIHATDMQAVFVDGDRWTCFGDTTECSGFFGEVGHSQSANYAVQITVPSGQTVSTGQNASYVLVVQNTGDAADTFTMSNGAASATVTFNQTNVSIGPGENATILFTVRSQVAGSYPVVVFAASTSNAAVVASGTITTTVLSGPTILSTVITPVYPVVGAAVTLGMTSLNAVNESVVVTTPSGVSSTMYLPPGVNATYSPLAAGVYNLTFIIIDALNASATMSSSFQAFLPVIFNFTIVDANQSGVRSVVTVLYNNTVLQSDNVSSGNYSEQTISSEIDLRLLVYNSTLEVVLHNINSTFENGKSFGIDLPHLPGYLTSFGIHNNYSITNATVTFSYAGTGYDDERYLSLLVCHDYNFTNRTCLGSFEDITAESTQNFVHKSFTVTVDAFSAFVIRQNTPETAPPPPSSTSPGMCGYRIDCDPWPQACTQGLRSRSCTYISSCGGAKVVYQELNRCGGVETPSDVSAFQMVGFLDLDKSQIVQGGTVQVKINAVTMSDDARVTFLYQIDGQDVIQDTQEDRVINKSDSFYTNISTSNLPPGDYNLTIRGRYGTKSAMLKEQFTVLVAPSVPLDPSENGTSHTPENGAASSPIDAGTSGSDTAVVEHPAQIPSSIESTGSDSAEQSAAHQDTLLSEIGHALETLKTIVVTPISTFFVRVLTIPTSWLVLLLIAFVGPGLYLSVRTKKIPLPHIRADRLVDTLNSLKQKAKSRAEGRQVAALKSRIEQTAAIRKYHDAIPAYAQVHKEYDALPESLRPLVYQDIVRLQEHLERAYFASTLGELSVHIDRKDLDHAITMYEQLSAHTDRMNEQERRTLIDLSYKIVQHAGLPSANAAQSPGASQQQTT